MSQHALRAYETRRLTAVRTINRMLVSMSEFGDHLPASTVIYALAAVVTVLYAVSGA